MDNSRCLRQGMIFDNLYTARKECIDNRQCLGIRMPIEKDETKNLYYHCLDAIYGITANDEKKQDIGYVYKKNQRYSKLI